MKRHALVLALVALGATTSCDRRDQPENAPTPEATTAPADAGAATSATDPAAVGSDTAMPMGTESPAPAATPADNQALALGLLAAVNEHEIQAAQQAIGKKVTGPVLDYARMMEKDHSDNLAATKALGALAETPEVASMKEKGASDLAELDKQSGKAYETAYVDAMVKGHTEVLALIDGRLLTLSSPGPVRDHLTKTRDAVAMHLQAAQKLQQKPAA